MSIKQLASCWTLYQRLQFPRLLEFARALFNYLISSPKVSAFGVVLNTSSKILARTVKSQRTSAASPRRLERRRPVNASSSTVSLFSCSPLARSRASTRRKGKRVCGIASQCVSVLASLLAKRRVLPSPALCQE